MYSICVMSAYLEMYIPQGDSQEDKQLENPPQTQINPFNNTKSS